MYLKILEIASPFSIIKKDNIKLPKFESLIVSEVRNLDSKFFVFTWIWQFGKLLRFQLSLSYYLSKNEFIEDSVKFLLQRE